MTAVDHAELKRVERLKAICAFFDGEGSDTLSSADSRQHGQDLRALLSEIEGLKAERDAYREAAHLEAVCGDDAERQLADIHTQAPDSWRPVITGPMAQEAIRALKATGTVEVGYIDEPMMRNIILAALRPQTAESGT